MARTTKADLLSRYRERVKGSLKWREQQGYDALWKRLIDLYRGKQVPKGLNQEDQLLVNISFATVNVVSPSVSISHPKFVLTALSPEHIDNATITEAVLNHWWKQFKFKPEIRMVVKDYLIVGHGWAKCGYRFTEKEQPRPEQDMQDEFHDLRSQVDQAAQDFPEMAGDLPDDDAVWAQIPETHLVVADDHPFVERVSPFDMVIDPDATSERDMTWIAQRIMRPVEDVKKDGRYRPSVRESVQPDGYSTWATKDDQGRVKTDCEKVAIWEFYDLKAGTMCVFANSGDGFLVEPQKMPYRHGHPFRMLRNYDVPDYFYPMGDLEAIEPLQLELNKLRTQAMNHRKRYARKYLIRDEAFGPDGLMALQDDTDNRIVRVVGDIPLNEAITPMPVTQLPPEFYQDSQQVQEDLDRVSGINEYMRGTLPDIRRTATEASIIQDAANSRAADKLSQVEEFMSSVAEAVICLAQQYLTSEQVAQAFGSDGAEIWFHFTHEDIQGDYGFEVEAGSTQPQNEAWRQKQSMDLLNSLGPFIQMGVVDPMALVKYVLQYGFQIKQPEQFLAQGPPPGMAPPGQPGMDPSMDPAAQQQGDVPAQAPPEAAPQEPAQGSIPPEILAQLAAQVGLNVG